MLGACATVDTQGARPAPSVLYTLIDARAGNLVAAREAAALCEDPCALLFVDGFDNSLTDSEAVFARVAQAYAEADGMCRMFGFTWPSDVGLFHFRRAEERAEKGAARALAELLAATHERCPTHPVHLAGHSLAARVILASLALGTTRVNSVALAAPAVRDDALLPSGEFAAAVSQIDRLAIYYNSQDYFVMAMLYPVFSRDKVKPLGLYGSRRADLLPENVREYDRSTVWGPRHSAIMSFDRAFWEEHGRTLCVSRTRAR